MRRRPTVNGTPPSTGRCWNAGSGCRRHSSRPGFVSLAHDEIMIDRTLMAAAEALAATDPRRGRRLSPSSALRPARRPGTRGRITPDAQGARQASAFGELAAGPRTSERAGDYAFVVEAVREGLPSATTASRASLEMPGRISRSGPEISSTRSAFADSRNSDDTLRSTESCQFGRVAAELRQPGQPDLAETVGSQIVTLACGKTTSWVPRRRPWGRSDGRRQGGQQWSIETAAASGLGREFDLAQTAIDSRRISEACPNR